MGEAEHERGKQEEDSFSLRFSLPLARPSSSSAIASIANGATGIREDDAVHAHVHLHCIRIRIRCMAFATRRIYVRAYGPFLGIRFAYTHEHTVHSYAYGSYIRTSIRSNPKPYTYTHTVHSHTAPRAYGHTYGACLRNVQCTRTHIRTSIAYIPTRTYIHLEHTYTHVVDTVHAYVYDGHTSHASIRVHASVRASHTSMRVHTYI
jgi:hypothetical protein